METLKERDILNVMTGAALLAAGGGGCFDDGMLLLNMFKEKHPDAPLEVKLCSCEEIGRDEYAAVVAGMGAPTEGAGKDFTPCAVHSFEEAQKLAEELGKTVKYTMPIEMGAFNTFAPMLISLMTGMPTVDADAAGRAVPGLDTILSHINGCDTCPLAMSDENGNIVHIKCADPKDAETAQSLAGPIAQKFQSNAGIAGWILSKEEISRDIPTGTITLARKVGEVIEELRKQKAEDPYIGELFTALSDRGIVSAKSVTGASPVRDFTTDFKEGFDVGSYRIGEGERTYRVCFQNENLLLYKEGKDGAEELKMTAPDIITMYDAATGSPITNEDLFLIEKEGKLDELEVVLGVIRVDDKWWRAGQAMEQAWKPYFSVLDHEGGIERFDRFNV